jgi:hypothetical protein
MGQQSRSKFLISSEEKKRKEKEKKRKEKEKKIRQSLNMPS